MMLDSANKFYLSFFYTGLSPVAPGTVGSLFAIPLLYLVQYSQLTLYWLIPIIALMTLLSGYLADHYEKKYQLHDSKWIVIDEVLGMLTAWCFFMSDKWHHFLLCFALFRLFDIWKPWPVSFFDKKISNGYGVMLDDIAAGLMAGGLFAIIRFFLPI
jgi:phosphatidylglycerophosphatase A